MEREGSRRNQNAVRSRREQKEGKARRLADDAGESGSKVLPLENRPPELEAEQNVPSLLQFAVGKGPSGENSASSPFPSGFQLISRLGCAVRFVRRQSAVSVSCFVTSSGEDLCDGSKHPRFADEPFQFEHNTIWENLLLVVCLKRKLEEIHLKLTINSILDSTVSKSSAAWLHPIFFFHAIRASLEAFLLKVKGT